MRLRDTMSTRAPLGDQIRRSQRNVVIPRLRALVITHLALGVLPVAGFLVPPGNRYLPLKWAMIAVGFGQLMVLSFWVGMSTVKGVLRLVGALCGTAYVVAWPLVGEWLSPHSTGPTSIAVYVGLFSVYSLVFFLLAGVFWLIRRSSTELRLVANPDGLVAPARFQYSILHVLIVMAFLSVVLGLIRSARVADVRNFWHCVDALMIITLVVNSICAAFAALGTGQIRLRMVLVLTVASLLGIALSLAGRFDRSDVFPWWMAPPMLMTVLSTAIVLGSLLVVRSCGYRLIPKAIAVG